jgi:hypothetical protein
MAVAADRTGAVATASEAAKLGEAGPEAIEPLNKSRTDPFTPTSARWLALSFFLSAILSSAELVTTPQAYQRAD